MPNAAPILSGIGPSTSSKSHYNGANSAAKFQIAFDNFGIQVGPTGTDYFSWIFDAPDDATAITLIAWIDGLWVPEGIISVQLYGGVTHNVNNTPYNTPNYWVPIEGPGELSSGTLNATIVASSPNIYPAYIIQATNASSDKGVVDWVISGS